MLLKLKRIAKEVAFLYTQDNILDNEKMTRQFIRSLTLHLLEYVTSSDYIISEKFIDEGELIIDAFEVHWTIGQALMDCAVTKNKLINPHYIVMYTNLCVDVLFGECAFTE
jgi:hypothetical protein